MSELVLELIIVIILEIISIFICSMIIRKSFIEKYYETARYWAIGGIIFITLFATIFECIWINMIVSY